MKDSDQPYVNDTRARPFNRVPDGTLLRELIHPEHCPARIHYGLVRARLEPGESSLPHREGGSELYYILEGRGVLVLESGRIPVEAGAVVWVPPDMLQWLECDAAGRIEFLCILEPPYSPAAEKVYDRERPS